MNGVLAPDGGGENHGRAGWLSPIEHKSTHHRKRLMRSSSWVLLLPSSQPTQKSDQSCRSRCGAGGGVCGARSALAAGCGCVVLVERRASSGTHAHTADRAALLALPWGMRIRRAAHSSVAQKPSETAHSATCGTLERSAIVCMGTAKLGSGKRQIIGKIKWILGKKCWWNFQKRLRFRTMADASKVTPAPGKVDGADEPQWLKDARDDYDSSPSMKARRSSDRLDAHCRSHCPPSMMHDA